MVCPSVYVLSQYTVEIIVTKRMREKGFTKRSNIYDITEQSIFPSKTYIYRTFNLRQLDKVWPLSDALAL